MKIMYYFTNNLNLIFNSIQEISCNKFKVSFDKYFLNLQ
jgi:hypothetical protein